MQTTSLSRSFAARRPVVALALAGVCLMSVGTVAEDKAAPKTNSVKIQDITLKVPDTWEQQEPSNKLRLAQFGLPKAEGDDVATDLVVSSFGGGGGGVEQNLPRWLNEFVADGRSVKLTSGKSPQGEYVLADLRGTHVGSSFARRPKPLEKARMLSVVLTVEGKGLYYLKLVGPEKSVGAQADALRASFGAAAKDEKEYKLEKGE